MQDNPPTKREGSAVRRLWPVGLLLLALVLLTLFGPDNATLFEALRTHRAEMLSLVAEYAVIADLLFAVIYAVAIAFSCDGAATSAIGGGALSTGFFPSRFSTRLAAFMTASRNSGCVQSPTSTGLRG